jgi:hypothetical protein
VVGHGFEPSFRIERGGGRIPRTAFLDERFNLNPAVEIIRESQALELASEIAVFINCAAVGRSSFASRAYASTAGFRFKAVSGVVWSRVSIGNMSRAHRPLSFLHNPLATVATTERDREFVACRDDDQWTIIDILAQEPAV